MNDPIGDLIQNLQQRKDDIMGRAYTPDPYSDKNADWFYSGGRMFAEQQDRMFEGLQEQINHLAALEEAARQQLAQGAALPDALANSLTAALARAGMTATDIARVLAGLTPTSGGSSALAAPPLASRNYNTLLRIGG